MRTKIKNICSLAGGGTPSRKIPEYFGGNIAWFTPTEIPKDKVVEISDSREKITELGLRKSSAKVVPAGSVLLTSRASIGFVAIAGTAVATNQGFASFMCNASLNNYYLAYWLWSKKHILEKQATGTTFKEISKSRLRALDIPLPPLSEQKRIVSKIESIFAKIDKTETLLKAIRARNKQLRQVVLKRAFEGKLVPQDPDDTPAECLKDEPVKSGERLPAGWMRTKIKNVCDLVGGGTPSRKIPEYFGGNIAWFTPTEIPKDKIVEISDSREKITELGLRKSSAKVVPAGSVLLTSRASIGFVAIAGTAVTTNQGFASFMCNASLSNYYLAYWLWSKKHILEKEATGTTFKEISKSRMRALDIPLPPLSEQKQIVSKIESVFARIDSIDEHIAKLLSVLAVLRKSVLKRAFEGRLVPQDPNDEPAYKLLERVRGA